MVAKGLIGLRGLQVSHYRATILVDQLIWEPLGWPLTQSLLTQKTVSRYLSSFCFPFWYDWTQKEEEWSDRLSLESIRSVVCRKRRHPSHNDQYLINFCLEYSSSFFPLPAIYKVESHPKVVVTATVYSYDGSYVYYIAPATSFDSLVRQKRCESASDLSRKYPPHRRQKET